MVNIESYIHVIKEKYPGLSINKFIFNNEGQNSFVVIINDKFIFKFPKYNQIIEELKNECIFLQEINNYITLEIPKPIFSSFENNQIGSVFVGYKMIKGVPLDRHIYYNSKNKHEIVSQIAIFLMELHGLSLENLNNCIVHKINSYEYWSNMYIKIKENIFPHIHHDAKKKIFQTFYDFLEDKENFQYEPVIVHGDLGKSNIIFDTEKEKVSGIIDFGQTSFNDPAIDIASLLCPRGYGEEFIELFLNIYPHGDAMIPRAKFYLSTFALQEALFGVETGDKDAFYSGIASYL